jgi:hypothetical protein
VSPPIYPVHLALTIYLPQGFPVSLKQENAEVMHERGFNAPQFVGRPKPGKSQPTNSLSCMQIGLHVALLIIMTLSESELAQRNDTRCGRISILNCRSLSLGYAPPPQPLRRPLWLHTSMPTPQTMSDEASNAASPETSATAVK